MKASLLNRIALLLSFGGLFVSGVLSVGAHYQYSIPCGSSHGCNVVAMHRSSHALGIPNAYIGFAAYMVFALLTYWRMIQPSRTGVTLRIGYAMSLLGTVASLVLTYIAVTVIGATCIWCLTSTGLMILLLIVFSMLSRLETSAGPVPGSTLLLAILSLITFPALYIEAKGIVNEANGLSSQQVDPNIPLSVFIPQDAHTFGDLAAPVTVVEFGDLLCHSCQAEYSEIKGLVASHPGKLKYVFRNFPMLNLPGHKQSAPAAIAAEVADEKGLFWKFLDKMYAEPLEDLKDSNPILDIAKSLGLDSDATFKRMKDQNDPAFKRVLRDIADGKRLGIQMTPTLFIAATGERVRSTTMNSLAKDLDRPEYQKLLARH